MFYRVYRSVKREISSVLVQRYRKLQHNAGLKDSLSTQFTSLKKIKYLQSLSAEWKEHNGPC